MNKYLLVSYYEMEPNAGTKIKLDIESITEEEGYTRLFLRKRYLTGKFKILRQIWMLAVDLIKIFVALRPGSLLLLQPPLPFGRKQAAIISVYLTLLSWLKNIHTVNLIIDIEFLRLGENQRGETRILKAVRYNIAHNDKMKQWLIAQGVPAETIIPIGIFDYLLAEDKKQTDISYKREVAYAGHLAPEKSSFLNQLEQLNDGVLYHLYGKHYTGKQIPGKIHYAGAVDPGVIANELEGSFGLVWDGHSMESCTGAIGEYLRINCPHKTSLYLAAGIPVIIWKEAALADFITKNNLGFTITSLHEIAPMINEISEDEYRAMQVNCQTISGEIRKGAYLKRALNRVEEMIGRDGEGEST